MLFKIGIVEIPNIAQAKGELNVNYTSKLKNFDMVIF